ncbi:hypothetical protein [Burkholderia gladioli]|uniref:hypothetical protein n=1 Tax=Burkholderia gladioli TaxID=28095 RepID=UPI00249EDDD3|nr:hypothetical protein [Burkholderia gladioli]
MISGIFKRPAPRKFPFVALVFEGRPGFVVGREGVVGLGTLVGGIAASNRVEMRIGGMAYRGIVRLLREGLYSRA